MSMPALMSALRSAGRPRLSAVTTIARPVAGSHVFRIDGYSHVEKMVPNGQKVKSSAFGVGGHRWRINCYPNGYRPGSSGGVISRFLEYASHGETGDASACFGFNILRRAAWSTTPRAKVPVEAICMTGHHFSTVCGLAYGYPNYLKAQDLDREEDVHDDCLTIICDITVLDMRVRYQGLPDDDDAH